MFKRESTYPTAVASYTDEGVAEAIRWCRSRLDPGQRLTIWTSQKSNLCNSEALAALAARPGVEHVTGRGGAYLSGRGPLLMAWPDQDDIGEMNDNNNYITALCVITWNADRIRSWVTHVQPEVLGDGSDWESLAPVLDPVAVEAMKSITMTINHNNTIAAGFEKDQVVGALLSLRDAGYKLDPAGLSGWAVAHGWSGKNPARLAVYAADINRGKRPRTTRVPGPKWIQLLRERSAGEN